jgi:hypothetical protein
MYGFQTKNPKQAIACSLIYWVFLCRNKEKTPAMGLKTWEYLQSTITNSATVALTIPDLLESLCKKMVVDHLNPKILSKIIKPEQSIYRVNKDMTEIIELQSDQSKDNLHWIGWESLVESFANIGVTERHIIRECKQYPHVLVALVRLRHEEERAIKLNFDNEEDLIDV